MASQRITSVSLLPFFLPILLIWFFGSASVGAVIDDDSDIDIEIGRRWFPPGFIFGAASAAYQVEGGVADGGRKPSVWDNFTHQYPEKINNGSNGDVASNSYHLYKEDVQQLKDMNMDAYRFSISWSRILPSGNRKGGINREGVQYYNNLINSLISKGLKPFVTIFHFDVPQALIDAYGGLLSEDIVKDFREYSDVLFEEFGDRVKHWITLNEPYTICALGYTSGVHAPGRCSPTVSPNCTGGNSGTEPYIVAHNMLLAHAAAVELYREKYQKFQKGSMGITLVATWYLPMENSKPDMEARGRALDFAFGWFMDPIAYGDYPFIMKALVGNRLPTFSAEQSKKLKGSFDFVGINYYTTYYVYSLPFPPIEHKMHDPTYFKDSYTNTTGFRNDTPIGPQAGSDWLFVYPQGIRDVLLYIKDKYEDPIIYITENGVDEVDNSTLPLADQLKDEDRIYYHKKHLENLLQAIWKGVRVKGYFAWSLLDNFEWADGYSVRFGIYYVDFNDKTKRYAKKSARWFKKILERTTANGAYGRIKIKGLRDY